MEEARELCQRLMQGDIPALARACRIVDDRLPGYLDVLREVHGASRRSWVLGVTGGAGVGKSSLVDRLITRYREKGERVAVLAVDPTSPFGGGALLGDRIRMQRHFDDPEVFIRSVATRGALGGLTRSAAQLTRLLSAWGASVVLLETVGVGQDELEVARLAHTTLVVTVPGLGDGVQALKAGVLEIADVFVVNKSDLPGAARATSDLEIALELRTSSTARDDFRVAVVKTSVSEGTGLDDLFAALERHRAWLAGAAGAARLVGRERERAREELRAELCSALSERLAPELEQLSERVQAGELDPATALDELFQRVGLR